MFFADVAELADAPDLGSGAARRMGSSPFIRTKGKINRLYYAAGFLYIQKKIINFSSCFHVKSRIRRGKPRIKSITGKRLLYISILYVPLIGRDYNERK